MSEENGTILDLGSIDFTPAWARKEAGVNVGKVRPARDDADTERFRSEGRKGGKSFGDGQSRGFGSGGGRKPFGDRRPFAGRSRSEGRPQAERPQPLDVEVKVLPETKALGTIIRKLQNDTHAYKLKDLAYFFLDNPSSVLLKITPRSKEGASSEQAARTPLPRFCQCKACGFASTREEDVIEHCVSAHLVDYYDAKEVEVEPPKGNFNCVAKCGLSGVLLGPPNIHEFNAVVKEMIRTKYPNLSEEQYRAHIEMVRDADAIEQWRQGATKKTLFFAKGTADQEGAQGLGREQAEGEFRRTVLPSMLETPKHLMITAEMAMKSPVRPLQWAANDALQFECRAPYNMCFALRGAFHHRKLHFFRANDARGPEFVSGVDYREFDAEHAIPELAAAAKFVAEHPCCDKTEFPAEIADFEKHLAWLVTTGHAIAFTNGVFSMVEKFPKYGPQWKKRDVRLGGASVQDGEPAQAEVPKPVDSVEKVETAAPVESVEKEPVESVEKEEVKDEVAAQLAE